jgi:hypothetical protein
MRYTRPDIGENTLAYKGRRYWIVKLTPGGEFNFVTHEHGIAEYVLWDCLYDGVIATLKDTQDGGVSGTLMSHVELTDVFSDIDEAAKMLPLFWDEYNKAVH